jgi:hypothetical protein
MTLRLIFLKLVRDVLVEAASFGPEICISMSGMRGAEPEHATHFGHGCRRSRGWEGSKTCPGDLSTETHITRGHCYQCRTGRTSAAMCNFGVDRDGAFAQYIANPEVAWKTGKEHHGVASIQEPFGNAVPQHLAHCCHDCCNFRCGPLALGDRNLAHLGAGSIW